MNTDDRAADPITTDWYYHSTLWYSPRYFREMATQNAPVVLITGINGFIGSMIGLRVLEKGYRVRAAVRNRSKLDTLLQGAYKEYAQQVEVAEVADIRRDDAYDQAVVGT